MCDRSTARLAHELSTMNRAAAEEIVDTVLRKLEALNVEDDITAELIEDCITDVQKVKVW